MQGRMTNNQIFETASIAVLMLYLGVLVWSVRHANTALLTVNMLTAIALIAYNLFPLRTFVADEQMIALVAFEIAAVIAAALAFWGNRPALFFSYAVFAVHLCVAIAAAYYACCVRFNRLI
jgi:ABC-type Na+ efflux pump permease subunit